MALAGTAGEQTYTELRQGKTSILATVFPGRRTGKEVSKFRLVRTNQCCCTAYLFADSLAGNHPTNHNIGAATRVLNLQENIFFYCRLPFF